MIHRTVCCEDQRSVRSRLQFSEVARALGPDAHWGLVQTPDGSTGHLTQQTFQSAAWHTVSVPESFELLLELAHFLLNKASL